MKHFKAICALAALAALGGRTAQAQDPWGSNQDVPTWRVGDSWNFTRDFTINVHAIFNAVGSLNIDLAVALNFTDNYSLAMTTSTVVTVAPPSFNDVYTTYTAAANVRNRTAGALSMVGSGRLTLVPADPNDPPYNEWVDLALSTAVADSSNGYSWTGIGDLAQLRENFTIPYVLTTLTVTSGTPAACQLLSGVGSAVLPNNLWCPCTQNLIDNGVPCFPTDPFSTNTALLYTAVDINLDHEVNGQGLEVVDFPTLDPYQDNQAGEEFKVAGNRILHGKIILDGDQTPGDEILNEEFATDPPVAMDYDIRLESLAATDPVTTVANLVYLKGQGATPWDDTIYYNPVKRELERWDIGPVGFSSGTPGLDGFLSLDVSGFRTINTAATVAPDAGFTNLSLVPDRPELAQTFEVHGTSTNHSLNGWLITPGGLGAPVAAVFTGNDFVITLLAPNFGDESDWKIDSAERESGSYGVLLVNSAGQRKVITARFAPISSAEDWELYE